MVWIDTHCHLNLIEHFPDPRTTIEEAQAHGVQRIVVVGIDETTSRIAVNLAQEFEAVYAVVGFHPTEVSGFQPDWLSPIRELATAPKVVAIGEIGLDFHWDKSSPQDQVLALRAQLDLAEELSLPVVYHCREAYDELLDIIERKLPKVPQLLHCFVGNSTQARKAISLGEVTAGMWFGVDGPITFKNATELREVISTLPRDRVVLETDSPFLSPHPFRGKPNSPKTIPIIGQGLAGVWDVSVEEVARMTTQAAETFFRLPAL